MSELSVKHLLGIKYITKEDIELIFKTADHFKEVINRPIKKVPSLRDITIANLWACASCKKNYLSKHQPKNPRIQKGRFLWVQTCMVLPQFTKNDTRLKFIRRRWTPKVNQIERSCSLFGTRAEA